MAYYYLYDGTSTYELDEKVWKLDLGMPKRNWKIDKNAGGHGGILRGQGFYEDRTISIELRFRGTGATAIDSVRNTFLIWINKAHWQSLYFYIKHANGTTITRTQCFPSPNGGESYKTLRASDALEFSFYCPNPFFSNVSADTGTLAITSGTEQTQSVTNDGNIDCPIKCKFTPTSAETFFQVKLAEDYGFTLTGNFQSGVQLVYDTANGSLTIGGVDVSVSQYLTAGSVFNILSGANTLYITCSGAGTFAWEFAERYV